MKASVRNNINSALTVACAGYHARIPLGVVLDICANRGAQPVQEDGTPWSGILCGREGRCSIALDGHRETLNLSWYRMPSGRYEFIAYVA